MALVTLKQRRAAPHANERRPWLSHSDGGGIFRRYHIKCITDFPLAHAAQGKACAMLGYGQLAIMAGGVLWFSGTNIISLPWRIYLCGLFLTLAMAGYWSGTLFFIGKLRAPHVRWMAPGILVLSGALFPVEFKYRLASAW
jgi:hypothetical protein